MKRNELVSILNDFLEIDLISDYGPNGLQVEGREEVNTIITGVTASYELIEKAVEKNADMLLVHHGILWQGQNETIKGSFKKRLKLLLENNINLCAYHLPLDRHLDVGNNAIMAKKMGLKKITGFGDHKGKTVGIKGIFKKDISIDELVLQIKELLNREPLLFNFGKEKIKNIGIVSGGGQSFFQQAVDENLDVFITGEVSEHAFHLAKEEEIHFISAGHHATERFGIYSFGEWISQTYGLNVEFIDVPNPV